MTFDISILPYSVIFLPKDKKEFAVGMRVLPTKINVCVQQNITLLKKKLIVLKINLHCFL